MHDSLSRVLKEDAAKDIDYLELRSQETFQTSIRVRNAAVESLSERRVRGSSVRMLRRGIWGFSFHDGSDDVSETVARASEAARSITPRWDDERVRLAEVTPVRMKIAANTKRPLAAVDISDKVGFLKDVCSRVKDTDDRIKSCWADYNDVTGRKELLTTEGTVVEAEVCEMSLVVTASAKDGAVHVSGKDELGAIMTGWEHLEEEEPAERISERLTGKILNQLRGVRCRRGSYPCVLGPKVVGMLAHEALGHLSEADLFCSGAFNGLEGKKVAPETVTMIDSPKMDGGFGNIEVDDEGVVPRDVVLIKEGTLGEQMLNREWAARLGREPTGNARAESYKRPPIIRMRNTYISRGDMDLDELVGTIGEGYYCGDVRGGQAESNSSFQIGIQDCYEIRDGEIGRPVRDLAISGIATKSLMLIDGVGNDFGRESSYCGKYDQSMATSDGGPHIRLEKGAVIFGGA